MSPISYTVRDASGKIVRMGTCQPICLAMNAGDGETVTEAQPGDRAEHAANMAAMRQRGQGFKAKAVTPLDTLVEALRAKGIEITGADLEAAAATLQARRTPPAGAGK